MTTATASLTNNVLTLADEVAEYFGGDYEGYDKIEATVESVSEAFRATGMTDNHYNGRLVLLTKAQLDVLGAVIDGFEPSPCMDEHGGDEGDHGDESGCFGYGPKALADLDAASTILSEAAR